MGSGGGSVGIAGKAEHTKVVVRGGCVVQDEVGSRVAHHLRGKAVEEVCGGVQVLCPIAGKERRLKEKAANHISGAAKLRSCVRSAVLGRGVGARETQLDAMSEKERVGGIVVELTDIITLQGTDRATKLGGYLGEEVCEDGERVGLQSKRKITKKMGKSSKITG
jgi:hypothetical protein